ncbi:MAG TPA: chorismate synthase [Blastocatellia bacterium]|nr:chorismate synthase [Blastocatellia bacterium]HMX27391.1 chorismate synthase [Blastocatellia bacterium]HMZ20835.1 chorismate synthase [Blastocatellia bacterium]HNG29037.1 chorismate synthase [Blastocatellia bacterium]
MTFNFTTAGESHGRALVATIEGLPAGLPIDQDFINHELWRRQQGYGRGGRMKIETDTVQILTGVRHGETLGSPVAIMVENKDFKNWLDVMAAEKPAAPLERDRKVVRPRPGHADLVGGLKYDRRDLRDILERASARETTMRVAVGAFAKQMLREFGIELASHVVQLGEISIADKEISWAEIKTLYDDTMLRCVDKEAEARMIARIDKAGVEEGDTLGGIFEVVAKGCPPGLGSHTSWFDKLDGQLAQAVMAIHAVKAVEIGDGVANAGMPGSVVHDEIGYHADKKTFYRMSNRAGGLEGGMTNGEDLRVRGYLKPIATLRKRLRSVHIETKEVMEADFERSDVTAVPAAGVIGEAMVAIVLARAMGEKFGGDSLKEMKRNFEGYCRQITEY